LQSLKASSKEIKSKACVKIVDAGIPLGNQTVLLKGVNNNSKTMEELCRKLVKNLIKPYYLYSCDLVNGIEHFRTKVSDGIDIMENLRGRISGLAIPSFIVDSVGGKGKIPLLPNYVLGMEDNKIIFRNYKNEKIYYPELKENHELVQKSNII